MKSDETLFINNRSAASLPNVFIDVGFSESGVLLHLVFQTEVNEGVNIFLDGHKRLVVNFSLKGDLNIRNKFRVNPSIANSRLPNEFDFDAKKGMHLVSMQYSLVFELNQFNAFKGTEYSFDDFDFPTSSCKVSLNSINIELKEKYKNIKIPIYKL